MLKGTDRCGRVGIQTSGSLISKSGFLTGMWFLLRVSKSMIYGELALKPSKVLVKNIVSYTH